MCRWLNRFDGSSRLCKHYLCTTFRTEFCLISDLATAVSAIQWKTSFGGDSEEDANNLEEEENKGYAEKYPRDESSAVS